MRTQTKPTLLIALAGLLAISVCLPGSAQGMLINPYAFVAAGPAWLVAEDMEGTGTPTGWTNINGDEDWDYTAVALDGSESWSATANTRGSYYNFDATPEVWFYCMMRFPSVASTASYVMNIRAGGTTLVRLRAMTNGTWRLENSGSLMTSGSSYAADTTYHIWLRYVKGTGSNSVSQFYISTTATRPSVTLTNSSGTATSDATRIEIGGAPSRVIIDKVRVSASEIGDDPS